MKHGIRKTVSSILIVCMLLSLSGCNVADTESDNSSEAQQVQKVEKTEASFDDKLKDNKYLYANDDETSVVTMYLTVSKGNASENTDHTWSEVNAYSDSDYERMGEDRYVVNGLLQVGDENGPLEGELGYEQYTPNATVTIRGQSSTRNAQKNYKISIKDEMGTWNDQRTINLNKHQGEGLRFRNKLAYDLMKNMDDMISFQTQFVHLYVCDKTQGDSSTFVDYGLYTQVEQPNKTFLKRHQLDSNGQLYKLEFFEFLRYEDAIKVKSDSEYSQEEFEEYLEIKGNSDHSKLISMLEDLNDSTNSIEDVVDKWYDKDNLFAWMAFHILTGNVDTQSRNALIYSPLNGQKWYFISWDNDTSFFNAEGKMRDMRGEAGWEHGISNYWGTYLFQRILKDSRLRAELDEKIEEYHDLLCEDVIKAKVEAYASVVKPYAYSQADAGHEPLTSSQYDEVCKALPAEIEENYKNYKNSLEEPMPFFIGKPETKKEKTYFSWDTSYDFKAQTITYSFELADNLEFNNPIASEEDILLPEYTYGKKLEPGQYFIRVQAKNEAGNTQYAFDYYVRDNRVKEYGIKCFYVLEDGSIVEEYYDE